ncbi:hypothetical protein ACHAPA_011547 [Fusarium lateritium]
MKAALFFAAAGLAAAQNLSGQPECALKCLQENIPKAGCELDDTACQCDAGFQEKLLPIITPCLTKACEVTDLVKAQSAAAAACEAFAKTAGAGSASATTAAPVTSVSIDTSVTGSATVPAIFSSIPEEKPIPPVTPRPHNGTMTKTEATTPTGTGSGGSGGSGGATSVPTDAGNSAAVAGPAFGLLAAIAAFVAL